MLGNFERNNREKNCENSPASVGNSCARVLLRTLWWKEKTETDKDVRFEKGISLRTQGHVEYCTAGERWGSGWWCEPC